jgi:hypothetical protein
MEQVDNRKFLNCHRIRYFLCVCRVTIKETDTFNVVLKRNHQGAHMILASYIYIGVHYRKNNGISCEVAPRAVFHNSTLFPAVVNYVHFYA